MPKNPSDIPESGRSVVEGAHPPDDGIDHDRAACLYPNGCTGCAEPTLEQLLDEIRELGEPLVACHPDLELPVGAVLPPGFGLVLNPHLPVDQIYVLPGGVELGPVPVVDWRMTPGEELRAQILAHGQLEHSAERRQARFTPPT